MNLVGDLKYILYNAVDEVIGLFDSLADLHRWINATYPCYSGEISKQGRDMTNKQVLPGVFRIERVKVE